MLGQKVDSRKRIVRFAVAMLLIVIILVAITNVKSEEDGYDIQEQHALNLINEYRGIVGCDPLSHNSQIQISAEYWAKTAPNYEHSGHPGEIIADTSDLNSDEGAYQALNFWKNSKDHNEILSNCNYNIIGIGHAPTGDRKGDVWTFDWAWVAQLESESSQPPPTPIPPPTDTTPPTGSFVSNPSYAKDSLFISAQVSDNLSGVQEVTLHIREENGSFVQYPMIFNGNNSLWEINHNISIYPHGQNLYYLLWAKDNSGNAQQITAQNIVTIDKLVPTGVLVIRPDYVKDTLFVTANVTDDLSGVSWVKLHARPQGGTFSNVSMTYNPATGLWEGSFNTSSYSNGQVVEFLLWAQDNVGNNNQITGINQTTVDRQAPTGTFVSAPTVVAQTLSISAQATDNLSGVNIVTLHIRPLGGSFTQHNLTYNGSVWLINYDLGGYSNGQIFEYLLRAQDNVGNNEQITGIQTATIVRTNKLLYNTQTGAQYLYANGIKHYIPEPNTAYALGTHLSTCTINMTTAEIGTIPSGETVPVLQNGHKVKNNNYGGSYILAQGMYWIPNPLTRDKLGLGPLPSTTVSGNLADAMTYFCRSGNVPDVTNSNFIKGSTPALYYLSGSKRYIPTTQIYLCLGGGGGYVLFPDNLLAVIPTGPTATCP